MELALVVMAAVSDDDRERHHAAVTRRTLAPSYVVETIDLMAEGVSMAMSRTERLGYQSDAPIVDPSIESHAALVSRAAVLVFVFPTRWWSLPQVLQAWLERTFVPGVAFTLDERNLLRPNLSSLRAIAGITTRQRPDVIADGGDAARRVLLRTMRLNAPRRVRTEWLIDPDDALIASKVGRL